MIEVKVMNELAFGLIATFGVIGLGGLVMTFLAIRFREKCAKGEKNEPN
jgi:hypothetical protein